MPQHPIKTIIEPYLHTFKSQEGFFTGDQMRHNYFVHHPKNDNLEEVKLKVSAIEDDEVHRHGAVESVARHILTLNKFDERVQKGELTLVPEIDQLIYIGQKLDLYPFATRYCNGHNEKAYPIFEKNIEILLKHYLRLKNEAPSSHDLRDYPTFVRILNDFITDVGIHDLNYQEIDKFLWIYSNDILQEIENHKKNPG